MFYIDDNYRLIIEFNENKNKIESLYKYEDNEIMGNIYRGRVVNIIPAMNAAFVDIGFSENAYLSLKDADKGIKEGEDILVEVKKLPQENKAPKVSMELSIRGRSLVYFPTGSFRKFSSKLSKSDRKRFEDFEMEGVLIRTEASEISSEDILREYEILKKTGEKILNEKNKRPTPKLIYREDNFKDYLKKNAGSSEIITNNVEIFKNLKEEFDIKYKEDFSIIYDKNILNAYNSLFDKKVELESGGNIVIEILESLTAIDVNTASFVGKNGGKDFQDTIYKNNLEAACEIARQIRLRNISGIIIVDFIDMKNKENQEKIINYMKKIFKKDEVNVKVHGFTKLGLLEISRKNNGKMLQNSIV